MLRNGERLRMTIVRDIRDRRAAQARIHHLAHHDALTGLPNNACRSWSSCSTTWWRPRPKAAADLALLFIDLDHFKRVNDSLGHLVGDTLLRTVAHPLACAPPTVVARFGGDEFMVLLHGRARASSSATTSTRWRASCSPRSRCRSTPRAGRSR